MVSFKSVGRGRGEKYGSGHSVMEWLHPRGVIDGLITAGMSCQAARRDVLRTCLERREPWRRRPSRIIERSRQLPLKWRSQSPVPSFRM